MRYTSATQTEPAFLQKLEKGDASASVSFRILTFTDLHLYGDGSASDRIALTVLSRTLQTEQPDFVVLTGDIILGKNAAVAAERLADVFEEANCYWAFVFGNHDGEDVDSPSKDALMAQLSAYPHCIAEAGDEAVWGVGNYVINLKNATGGIMQSLVFMDTGSNADPALCAALGLPYQGGYDFIKPNQIDWYKEQIANLARLNGGTAPTSTLYIHIPLPEYKTAYYAGERLFGRRLEGECAPKTNTGMFDAVVAAGSTKTVVAGHDHINDYAVQMDGITLMYSQSLSFGSYFSRRGYGFKLLFQRNYRHSDGHTQFVYDNTGGVTITPRHNQDISGIFEGLEAEFESLGITRTLPK